MTAASSALLALCLLAPEAPGSVALDLDAAEHEIHRRIEDGDWRAALERARELHAAAPADARVRTLLAEALFRAGRLGEVEAALEGLQGAPQAPARAWVTLGRLREAQGRDAEAQRWMRQAVERAPDDPEVLFHAAGACASRAEAIGLLERYLAHGEGQADERITSARGQLRLYRALGERPVWVTRERPERAEYPLDPLWVPQSGAVVGYRIEAELPGRGKPVRLLLDSGSPGLFVIERVARKRGFEPLSELTVFGGGGKGRHETSRGFFPAFTLGPLAFRDALASAARQELDPQGRYHGLVGLSVFNGYRVTLDLAERRLTLASDPGVLEGGAPYYSVDGQMLVEVATRGGEDGLFLFDTGSTNTLVADSLVERIASAESGASVELPAYGGTRSGARTLRGVEIVFQGRPVATPALRQVDLSLRSRVSGVEISGFLGLDALDGKRIEIDTLRRTLLVRDARSE